MSQIVAQKVKLFQNFTAPYLYETGILTLKPINRIFVAENPFWRSKAILARKKFFMKWGPGRLIWTMCASEFLPSHADRVQYWHCIQSSSFVSIISEFSHMFGQALAQWRAFSLAVARSSRLHSFSRSGHLSRCCMVCSEVPHSQAVSAVSA